MTDNGDFMERAWNFIWDNFYDSRTSLFYDYLVRGQEDPAVWHLPDPELIKRQIPNPCGHGTGMEDSMLIAGTMMDTVLERYRATGDETMRTLAAAVYSGMELCADVAERPGYLARSVSPVDGVSHYSNSSRDQYTHWVYGAYMLYISPLSDEEQRQSIRRILVGFAEMCERDVVPENNWSILREDGKIGIYCEMWGDLYPHEYLRLPMIYAAAWKVTEDAHWKEMYLRYRDEAFEKTLPFSHTSGRTYIGLQLQYSLKLLYELDEDEEFRLKCADLMRNIAEQYEPVALSSARSVLLAENLAKLSWEYKPWNKVRASYVGFIGEMVYYNPGQSEFSDNGAFYPLRAVGEAAAVAALCPGYAVSDEVKKAVKDVLAAVDYDTHNTYAPLALINAYWLMQDSAN